MDINSVRLSGFADEIASSIDMQIAAFKSMNIPFIELRRVDEINVSMWSDEMIHAVRQKLDAAGIGVSSIGSPIGKIDITDDFEPHFEAFCRVVEIAKMLNAPYIRMFSFFIPEGEDPYRYQDEVLRRLSRMVKHAQQQDIVLLHENEKGIFGNVPERCRIIMDALACDHFKAVFDFSNFVQCGADTLKGFELMRPYIEYVHIKDALAATGSVVPAGYGDGHMETILRTLFSEGYHGFLSLEPDLSDSLSFADSTGYEQLAPALGCPDWRSFSSEEVFRLAHESLAKLLARI